MFRSLLAVLVLAWIVPTLPATSEEGTAKEGQGETFLLRYKLQGGEKLRYEVTHVAKTKTRIRGAEEVSQVQTTSQRHWNVVDVSDTEFTFQHILDAVEMTQQQGEAEEVRWNSGEGTEAPAIFARIAEQIGRPLSTITATPRGQELKREDDAGTKTSLGMGSLILAFPEEPMAVGGSWSIPREVRARTEDGEVKPIKIRELFTLEKVETGVATLSMRSEPLTPITEESIRAQVVQQLSNGTIRFDIDNGRMLSKQLDWDETVVGFQGANSLMEYRARFTEKLIDNAERAASLK